MVISVCTPPQMPDSMKLKLVDEPLVMFPNSYDPSSLYSTRTSNASKALRFVTSYTMLRGRDCSKPQTGTAATASDNSACLSNKETCARKASAVDFCASTCSRSAFAESLAASNWPLSTSSWVSNFFCALAASCFDDSLSSHLDTNHATGESTMPRTVIAKSIQAVGFCAKSPCARFHNHVTIIDLFRKGSFMLNLSTAILRGRHSPLGKEARNARNG